MIEEFKTKLKNNEYISNILYKFINRKYPYLLPDKFNIDKYNKKVLEQQYHKNKEYFNNLYNGVDDSIHLDKEQIKSILADDDYTLVIAGAGTGKTTTIVAKVKYLVDIKKVDPSKILVMSYTKKATEELSKKINIDFDLPYVNVTTFHSLGFNIVRKSYQSNNPYVIDTNERNQIFLEYFKELFKNKSHVKEVIDIFDPEELGLKWVFTRHFRQSYDSFNTWDEYFESFKKFKIEETNKINGGIKKVISDILDKDINSESIYSIKGELVKSKGEVLIANYLFENNIPYEYEKVYSCILEDNKSYKPDFTLNIGGEEVYIEYFGLSNYKENEMTRYDKIRKLKEDYHASHHNKFIKLDYKRGEDVLKNLKDELEKLGFVLKPKSDEEIYDAILSRNELAELFNYRDFLYKNIDTIKSSYQRDDKNTVIHKFIDSMDINTRPKMIRQCKYIIDFFNYYQKRLYGNTNYGFDFSDMIYYGKKNLAKLDSNDFKYDYIIIDEYQDISYERYELANEIVKRDNSKIIAVGDDWQAIYSFAGSKIDYIYNFNSYFKDAKVYNITKTYRNCQDLVTYAGKFIMKNDDQIKKNLVSDKAMDCPIKFVNFEEGNEIEELKNLIKRIHTVDKDHNILILSRYNEAINKLFNDPFFKDDVDTRIKISSIKDLEVEAMSIHKSKGLTADEVIIIGLDKRFPMKEKNTFWLIDIFRNRAREEKIKDAEERRIFYVALTRTRNHVFLLTSANPQKRSTFVSELSSIINKK